MTIDRPDQTADRDFLFVIEIKKGLYKSQSELIKFLEVLPASIRVYAVIQAGMNTLKVYCVSNSVQDYASVAELTVSKTEILDRRNSSGNTSVRN